MLIKDITKLEQLQRRATKFILQDSDSDYKSRLLSLNLLPLVMMYELSDITFFISNVKNRSESFDIMKYVSFNSSNTRSGGNKLVHSRATNNSLRNLYFSRLVRLWNALPIFDLSLSEDTLRMKLKSFLMSFFKSNFVPNNTCSLHFLCPCSRCSSIPKAPNFISL